MANSIFSGVREKWLPLYEQFHNMAQKKLGVFDEYHTSGKVLWKHNSSFVEITAKKDCMVVAFASDILHDEWKHSKVLQTSKNRVVHYFEVTDDTFFPELIEHINQAYILTQSAPVRKKVEEKPIYTTIDGYIVMFPDDVQDILKQIRETIRKAAPNAKEKISWQMPTFWQDENLVHFASAKNHIGFYPGESGVRTFAHKLTDYKTSKGAIQFPLSQPVPYNLITEITRFRVKEILEKKKGGTDNKVYTFDAVIKKVPDIDGKKG
nr:DUF5655 domain-containing protein [uncultured Aminipila sp.]